MQVMEDGILRSFYPQRSIAYVYTWREEVFVLTVTSTFPIYSLFLCIFVLPKDVELYYTQPSHEDRWAFNMMGHHTIEIGDPTSTRIVC